MVLMSVIMLFDLILITAVVPIVRKIESNKDKILKVCVCDWLLCMICSHLVTSPQIFLDVPIVVVRYLKQRCQDRLEILTELEGDNELPPGELIYEDDKARDWSTTNFKVLLSHSTCPVYSEQYCVFLYQVRRRVFRKSLKLYFYLLLKFAGPAFGIVCYLTMMYLWDTIIMDSIQFAKNNAYYTQQRRVLVRLFVVLTCILS